VASPVYPLTFHIANPPANTADQPLAAGALPGAAADHYVTPFNGDIVAISLSASEDLTGGSIVFDVKRNGAAVTTPGAELIGSTFPRSRLVPIDHGVLPLKAGDRISMVGHTDGAFVPTTADFTITLWCMIGSTAPG